MYLVLTGEAAIMIQLPNGEFLDVARRSAGDFVGEVGLLDRAPTGLAVRGKSAGEVAIIPRAVFLELLERFPALTPHLLRRLAAKTVESFERQTYMLAQYVELLGFSDTTLAEKRELEELTQRLQTETEAHRRTQAELAEAREEAAIAAARLELQLSEFFVGYSPAMQRVYAAIEQAAQTDRPVYLLGETGSGKELAAAAIHKLSRRRTKPFIALNCGAIAPELAESELFGHERGAFTGAAAAKPGQFELADGGVLFLDEIAELPPDVQPKLLRALAEGEIRPVGGQASRRVNVRIIAATNKDLQAEVAAGRFREDLYYRLNVLQISLPPLRERAGDIDLLAHHFLAEHLAEHPDLPGMISGFAPDTLALLERYAWPGNVRELRNVIDKAVFAYQLAKRMDGILRVADLPPEVVAEPRPATTLPAALTLDTSGSVQSLKTAVKQWELAYIQAVLRQTGGNKSKAAQLLGVTWITLQRKLTGKEK